ncbi:murein L,D-transpeptidase catalytic domain family protein [Flavobacterium sp.]|uniref:murein L,D-transpeptidase catalytic domain family protein n=1 Tax=Flavobacterium sp. TaxID=239 RepID=UPI002B4B05A4|nr:murein L,D-transpeptidase catalytic domain family protein [Flavobacterium sp.]HLP65720.1 murein L,D-transpeptidase catalytic domain family protein [Flavobacterium sp.]
MLKRFLSLALIGFCSFTIKKDLPIKSANLIETTKKSEVVPSSMIIDEKFERYQSIESNGFDLPEYDSFSKAMDGFDVLKDRQIIQSNILTIIDFDLPSTQKRLWVIDMDENKVLFHSLVAHGKNSGELNAQSFSNENESYKSSLGFFITSETYQGSHGLSLKLDGLEKNKNDNARSRAIVIHGADYVSEGFIREHNRLGRSFGCPALPLELTKSIISTIKNKSCLFIHHHSNQSILL